MVRRLQRQWGERPMTTAATDSDRRAHRRAPLDVPAMLEAPSACETARCRNVSAGGIAIESRTTFDVGTTVDVYFELPSGVAVETSAEVVRAEAGVVALRFKALEAEQRLALRAHSRVSGLHRIPAA